MDALLRRNSSSSAGSHLSPAPRPEQHLPSTSPTHSLYALSTADTRSTDTFASAGTNSLRQTPGGKALSRPPRSPRRPTSNSNLIASALSPAHSTDVSSAARGPYGLPSPPQTSSEASGDSVGGSVRVPSSVLQPAEEPSGAVDHRGSTVSSNVTTNVGRRDSTASQASSTGRAADEGRSKRLLDLKERSAKIMNSLSSRQTPSPSKRSVDSPTSQLVASFAATTISSPKPSLSSSRHSLSGEETERAHSASSQGSSPVSDRSGRPMKGANGKKVKRVSIDSSGGGRGGWPFPPALSRSGHERTASLPLSREDSSDGGLSRSSSGSSSNHRRRVSGYRSSSSVSFDQTVTSPPPSTPATRRLRGTVSPSSSAALFRSESTTSVSSQGSSRRDSISSTRTPLRSATATRVRPTSTVKRSDDGTNPPPTPTSTAPRATPSSRNSRTLAMTSSPSTLTDLNSRRMSREPSSSSSSRSRSSGGLLLPIATLDEGEEASPRPGKERQTSAEEVEDLLSAAGDVDRADREPRRRERTASNGKKRAPLPSEFTSGSVSSTASSSSSGRPVDDCNAPSPSTTSFTDRQRTYSTRSNASPVPRHTPSPGLRRFESTARPSASPVDRSTPYRSSALRPNGAPRELQPRYLGRGGSEESALAGKPSVSRLGGLGIDFPKADQEDDLFSDGSSQAVESRASRTRDLLRRIEQEDQESERKTRELREVHAIKRAESSMSIGRSPDQQDGYAHPATPLHRRNINGPTRGPAFTAGLPLRPSTSMAFTSDAPRTAPTLGQGLRSHRSVWNLQTPSSSSSLAGQREGSPSPSLVRRRRLSGDPSGLGEGGRRTAIDLRLATSFEPPSSTSVQSSLSSFATWDSQHPEHVRNMLAAFEALERHHSRLSGYSSTAAVVQAAHSLVSAVEQANVSLTQANNFVREQVVAAQVDERKEVEDVEAWQAMLAVIKDAVRMNDEEVRASTALMIATLKVTRELMSAQQQPSGRGSGEIRRSETADWTSYRHGRETSEPSPMRADHYVRPSTSMGYATVSSPSVRLRDNTFTRDRLASIPSSRALNLIDVDVPSEASRSFAPSLQKDVTTSRRTGVLGHVFDRFAPRRASEDAQPTERSWRQPRTSSTSTVRGTTSLFPTAPKLSPAAPAVSHVTATHGSPERFFDDLPSDMDEGDGHSVRRFLGRAKTLSLASSSSPMVKQSSAGSDSTLGRRSSTKDSSPRHSTATLSPALGSPSLTEPERRQSNPRASPIASIRRLSLFGGSKERRD